MGRKARAVTVTALLAPALAFAVAQSPAMATERASDTAATKDQINAELQSVYAATRAVQDNGYSATVLGLQGRFPLDGTYHERDGWDPTRQVSVTTRHEGSASTPRAITLTVQGTTRYDRLASGTRFTVAALDLLHRPDVTWLTSPADSARVDNAPAFLMCRSLPVLAGSGYDYPDDPDTCFTPSPSDGTMTTAADGTVTVSTTLMFEDREGSHFKALSLVANADGTLRTFTLGRPGISRSVGTVTATYDSIPFPIPTAARSIDVDTFYPAIVHVKAPAMMRSIGAQWVKDARTWAAFKNHPQVLPQDIRRNATHGAVYAIYSTPSWLNLWTKVRSTPLHHGARDYTDDPWTGKTVGWVLTVHHGELSSHPG